MVKGYADTAKGDHSVTETFVSLILEQEGGDATYSNLLSGDKLLSCTHSPTKVGEVTHHRSNYYPV